MQNNLEPIGWGMYAFAFAAFFVGMIWVSAPDEKARIRLEIEIEVLKHKLKQCEEKK